MGEIVRTYRDLIAWQRAMELVQLIYVATNRLPACEQFGLQNQMRRAAVSIPSNIAEGFARQSTRDYLRFLRISRGSVAEVSTQYELSLRLGYVQDEQPLRLIEETDRILVGLIEAVRRSKRRRD